MRPTTVLELNSIEQILANLNQIIDIYKKESVVCIRGANLSYQDQLKVTKAIGDVVGWFPNNSSEFEQKYVESHSRIKNKELAAGEDIVLGWHMEHVEYDEVSPIVAGVWNMTKFTADPEVGKTYFVNSSELFKKLSEEDQEFFKKCEILWYEGGDESEEPFKSLAVKSHWLTGEETIRMSTATVETTPNQLASFDGRTPTEPEISKFMYLRTFLIQTIHNDINLRIEHKWAQGDLLIPDLFKGIHAATGGFSSDQREFVGLWIYPNDPELSTRYRGLTDAVSVRND